MASTMMSTARIASARPTASKPRSASRPSRAIRVFAAAQENQGPKDAVLKTFGAIAAAQLALLPMAGEAVANIIPNQSERAEINQKTSDLPTFGQVGDALKKNLGQNDPKDIGKAIDRNTPDLDLTKNPKDIGKDIKRGIEKNTPNLPDLSELPSPQQAANKAKNAVKDAGRDIGRALPNTSGNPGQRAVDKAQNVGSDVAKKAKNVTSDLSDLPNPFKGNADPSKLARDAKNQAKNLTNDVGKNIPNAGDAKRAIDKNTPNLPNLGGAPGTGQGKGTLNIPRNS